MNLYDYQHRKGIWQAGFKSWLTVALAFINISLAKAGINLFFPNPAIG